MRDRIKGLFRAQRNSAKVRGIEFQFTYEEWLTWWGDDIVNRGQGRDKLVMARHGDIGPYHPDNCKKITHSENTIEGNKRRNASEETRRKIGEASKNRTPWNKGKRLPHALA